MPPSPRFRAGFDRLFALGESRRGPFELKEPKVDVSLHAERPRFGPPAPGRPRRTVALTAAFVVVLAGIGVAANQTPAPQKQGTLVNTILPASDDLPIATGSGGSGSVASDIIPQTAPDLTPQQPGSFASPVPAAVANEPPLKPHEVFGFAPYWTLPQSGEFDVNGLTTLAYFAVGVNPDGSMDQSGTGWQGFESQNFIDLINRAHAAGDRVVLTVNDFSQSSLDQLTLSQTAPATLAQSLLFLVKSRNLDGVNLDLEGEGSGDQAGLTNLVKVVSATLHAANPNYQVTMDTYASSAGDASGYYDIPALSQYVDAFFVMAYQLNLHASPGSGSPLTSSMFSNQTTVNQYTNAVPASKVILGLPFFGYDWPTSDGTLNAQPQGGPTIVTYDQEATSSHPIYWDSVTDTAWTSYQVGQQWHEAFFEDPNSLYLAAQMATGNGIGGVGIWALGMDGSGDEAMVSALDGNAPAQKGLLAGPASTSSSSGPIVVAPQATAATSSSNPTRPPVRGTTTTTARPPRPRPTLPVTYSYSGGWEGAVTSLIPTAVARGKRTLVGTMTTFSTQDPKLSCLGSGPPLNVFSIAGDPGTDYVIARAVVGDCANATFAFSVPASPPTSTTTSTTTTSTSVP